MNYHVVPINIQLVKPCFVLNIKLNGPACGLIYVSFVDQSGELTPCSGSGTVSEQIVYLSEGFTSFLKYRD
jgi:hypothetical protein